MSLSKIKFNQNKGHKVASQECKYKNKNFLVKGLDSIYDKMIIDCQQHKVSVVCDNEFKQLDSGVFRTKSYLVKWKHGTRNDARTIYKLIVSPYKCESWAAIQQLLTTSYDVCRKITRSVNDPEFTPFLLDVASFLLNLSSPHFVSFQFIISELLRLYSLYVRGKRLFIPETLDVLFLSAILPELPGNLADILRRMSLLTNKKILDVPNLFVDLIGEVSSFLQLLIMNIPFLPDGVKTMLSSCFLIGKKYSSFKTMSKLLGEWKKDPKILIQIDFINRFETIDKEISEDKGLFDYFQSSPSAIKMFKEFIRVKKAIDSYRSLIRSEPCCFVYEGPPGVMKSKICGLLMQSYGEPVYSHIIKSVNDGKDFYDGYNNERIFTMDDVGQQGVSQWRSIINMVSTLRLPLDCADAPLKGTKFFSSELLFVTTNNFQNLRNCLTKNDAISDIEALWRRGHVFDFSKVVRVGGELSGFVTYKRFDVNASNFIGKCAALSDDFPRECDSSNILRLVAWMRVICDKVIAYNRNVYVDSMLTGSQLEQITSYADEFGSPIYYDTESFTCFSSFVEQSYEFLNFYVEYICAKCIECCKLLPSNKYAVFGVLFGLVASSLLLWFSGRRPIVNNAVSDWRRVCDKMKNVSLVSRFKTESGDSTLNDASQKFMKVAEVYDKSTNRKELVQCLVSGHCILLPYHAIFRGVSYIDLYNNFDAVVNKVKILDHVPVTLAYFSICADFAILKTPVYNVSPFKKCAHFFKADTRKITKTNLSLINSDYNIHLPNLLVNPREDVTYSSFDDVFVNTLRKDSIVMYDGLSVGGICGSLILDKDDGFIGMHVTGNGETGVSSIFSNKDLVNIATILSLDGNVDPIEISDKLDSKTDFSGSILDRSYNISSQKCSNFVPSPLYGMFPVNKKPANLQSFGIGTVAEMAQKSFKPVSDIPKAELEFASRVINSFIVDFGDITDVEVVKGNDVLAPINKDSVNGLFYTKFKKDYIDFDSGIYLPAFDAQMKEFEHKVKNFELKFEDIVCYEAIKDELRVLEKVDKPRTFRVTQLHINVWMKKVFGSMAMHLSKYRDFNQIMVGVNPYLEWDKIYHRLSKYKYKWDGDVGSYDGKMPPQIQDLICNVFKSKYIGDHLDVFNFLCEFVVRAPVAILNKLFVTTHSVGSGIWLTALFNSLCNRAFTACWYYRETIRNNKTPSIEEFLSLFDHVYGDDKLNGSNIEYLNALTMKNFFNSIGMEFTAGDKTELLYPSFPIDNLTFLKRKFLFHPELGKIMCPLSLVTLENSLMWLDKTKDQEVVMAGKLSAYQREMYLHYDKDITDILDKFQDKVNFILLPISYLKSLYLNEADLVYDLYKQDFGKNY